jgi:histone H3/H4
MTEMIIVKTKIKDFAPGFNISGNVAEALDLKTKEILKNACERAQANGRKTIMAKDL